MEDSNSPIKVKKKKKKKIKERNWVCNRFGKKEEEKDKVTFGNLPEDMEIIGKTGDP